MSIYDASTRLRCELPHVQAHCRDGSTWGIRLDNLEGLRSAWMAGMAFWSGIDVWDQPVDIKLADITAVRVITEEGLAITTEENEERKRRELTA